MYWIPFVQKWSRLMPLPGTVSLRRTPGSSALAAPLLEQYKLGGLGTRPA
jgi:hypothetical protein